MNKILLFILSIGIGTSLNAQIPELPEILQEQLMQEKFDLTNNVEVEEQEKSEDEYYRYVPRNGGTDTLFGYKWNKNLEDWALKCRIIKTLNDAELPSEKLVQMFTSDSLWLDGLFYEYTYNENDDLTEVLIQYYKADSMVWVNHFKMERTYNDVGDLSDILTMWWSKFNEEWIDHHNKVFTFNDQAYLIADTVKIFNHFMQEWHSFLYNGYEYNDTGIRTTKTNYIWLMFMEDWTENYRLVYSYDGDNENIIMVLGQFKPSPDSDWKDATRYNYTYNDADKLTLYVFEKWNNFDSSWVEKVMIDYTYDANNYLSQFVWQRKPFHDSVWRNFKQAFFTFDENGNMTEKTEQRWDFIAEEWVNFRKWVMALEYTIMTDIFTEAENHIQAQFRNPYQDGDLIKLDGLQKKVYTFKLLDINGKVIEMQNLSGNSQLILQNKLNPGIYILTLSDGQKVNLTKKLMVAH